MGNRGFYGFSHHTKPWASGDQSVNLARGKTYTITPAPNASYPDTNGVELTDGDRCLNQAYNYAGYCAPNGAPPVVVVDLATTQYVREVRVYGNNETARGIQIPTQIQVDGSNDGVNYTTLRVGTWTANGSTPGSYNWLITIDVSGTSCWRYWKLTCSGNTNYTFLGEVELWS